MNILQLGKFYPIKGGVEKVMFNLMCGLSERDIHCDMLCASEDKHSQTIKKNDCSTIFVMPSITRMFGTMISPKLISRLKEMASNYDIIHIHHPDPMAAFALFMSGYKGKIIVHWHSDILKQKVLQKLIMPLQNWLLHRAIIIVGTTPVYVKYSPHLAKFQDKVTYIPIGVEKLKFRDDRMKEIRSEYKGKRIVFSLGRLVEYKGFKYLTKVSQVMAHQHNLT